MHYLLELSRRSLSACKVWGRSNYVCRLWERKLVFFFYVTLGLPAPGGHSSNKYCVTVYVSILMRYSAIFSKWIVLSNALHSSHFCFQMAPQGSRNCGQKLRKVQKSMVKFVRTTSYRQLRDLKKIPLQQFRAENVDVHLYNFFACHYIVLTAIVKLRTGSP